MNVLRLHRSEEGLWTRNVLDPSAQQIISEATQFFIPANRWQLFVTETDSVDCWECRPDVEEEEGRAARAQTALLEKQ